MSSVKKIINNLSTLYLDSRERESDIVERRDLEEDTNVQKN